MPNLPKSPLLYLALLGGTILLGLGVRWPGVPLPIWFTKPAGDVLYATAAYWGWRLVLPDYLTSWTFLATCLACAGIEFLKFYQAPWMVALRGSGLGRLVFGVGFHWENLLCYFGGASLAWGLERVMRKSDARARSSA